MGRIISELQTRFSMDYKIMFIGVLALLVGLIWVVDFLNDSRTMTVSEFRLVGVEGKGSIAQISHP